MERLTHIAGEKLRSRRTRVFLIMALVLLFTAIVLASVTWFLNTATTTDIEKRNNIATLWFQTLGGIVLVSGLYLAWERINIERETAYDRSLDDSLQRYFDGMSQLLSISPSDVAEEDGISQPYSAFIYSIASALTDTMLRRLDGERLELLVRFLSKARLINAAFEDESGLVFDLSDVSIPNAQLARIDLSGANFRGANFRGANFLEAFLNNVILRDAALINANLTEARLAFADLTGANMTNAVLTDADITNAALNDSILVGANLRGADLSYADLTNADLTGADLTGADLTGAIYDDTTMTPQQRAQVIIRTEDEAEDEVHEL